MKTFIVLMLSIVAIIVYGGVTNAPWALSAEMGGPPLAAVLAIGYMVVVTR
jgi:hypothetical protein